MARRALGTRRRRRRARPDAALALPRRVDETVLYRVLRANLETFLEEAARTGRPVPGFIEKELRAFVECGIAANGFLRVHCSGCGHDRLLPFSCKRRGFCPRPGPATKATAVARISPYLTAVLASRSSTCFEARLRSSKLRAALRTGDLGAALAPFVAATGQCSGRRMAEGAANLVDLVLPLAPVRQWTLSLPFDLRFKLEMDHRLTSRVLRVVMRAVLGFQRSRARKLFGICDGHGGAVTIIQRFGSALNLDVHFHAIVLDGVHFEDEAGRVRFQALPAPRHGELLLLVETIARRVHALLDREGLRGESHFDKLDDEESRLTRSCLAGAARGVTTIGPRAGRRLRRLVGEPPERAKHPPDSCRVAGFDLHVGRRIRGADREGMEKLARYALRGPVATERLTELPDGRLKYEFRHSWRDGTQAVLLEPLEFIERLVALIPVPRRNLVRYHGSLAPGSKLRARIVPAGPAPAARPKHAGCEPDETGERASRRLSWAELMRRVFETDVLECPRCATDHP